MTNPIGYDPRTPLTGATSPSYSSDMNIKVAEAAAAFNRIYIPFPRHSEFHARCHYLMKLGEETRGEPQMGMRVLAPTGSGKTTAARELIHLVEREAPPTASFIPVVYVPLERAATAKKLMIAILDYFGDPFSQHGNEMLLRKRVYTCFERFGTRLLIIDEVQHLNYRRHERNDVTDSLKGFLDGGVVPVVFLGTDDATDLFTSNRQLTGRLLPPCDFEALQRKDPNQRSLLAGYAAALDEAMLARGLVQRHSGFADKWIRGCLHEVSGGVIGRISRLVFVALENSIRRGADCVEVYDLALAVDHWAIPAFIEHNPFRRERGE
jgi:hypothetical protein